MSSPPVPFQCEYSPQFAVLLSNLGMSLVLSTYQAGKAVVVSAVGEDKLIQLPKTFPNAMGMAIQKHKLAIATTNSVEVMANNPILAPNYPGKPGVYDGLYTPRASYYTGQLNLHDLAYLKEGNLVAVNTLFSCLSEINDQHSFTPFWRPPFIDELAPEDRCHLNGLAIEDGEIRYLSALGNTNTGGGWRENKMQGGIIMEYPSGKIIAEGLSMPHSPRIYDGILYILNSARGELLRIDPENGKSEVVCKLGAFARGMDIVDDYLFIGVSKLRHNSKEFKDLDIAATSFAGVIAVYLPYGSVAGFMKYQLSVDEIYDVKVLRSRRPGLMTTSQGMHVAALSLPDVAFWGQVAGKVD